jgi:hypothetical protein
MAMRQELFNSLAGMNEEEGRFVERVVQMRIALQRPNGMGLRARLWMGFMLHCLSLTANRKEDAFIRGRLASLSIMGRI